MSVERINPASTYQQDQLSRIQDNLIRGIDNVNFPNTQLVDAGYYWSQSYPGGIVNSLRTIYNPNPSTATITQWFQFPVQVTIQNVAMLNNNTINARSDFYIYTGAQQMFESLGLIAPMALYGTASPALIIPPNTQFNVAYGYPVTGLNIASYSYLLLQVGT